MHTYPERKSSSVARLALLIFGLAAFFGASAKNTPGKTEKLLSQKEARRVIARTAGAELKTDAVRVRDVALSDAPGVVVVNAGIETAVRFKKSDDEKWVATEFRIGDRRWEAIESFVGAIGTDNLARAREELGALAGDFIALRESSKEQKELRRGGLRATDASSLLSSAVVVIEVEASFHLAKDAGRKWRVVEVKFGGDRWRNVDALMAAANAAKNTRARAELQSLRAALEAYRAERGSYVVSDEHTVVVDYLSPRYLPRVVRLDPWQRPYRYTGTREQFVLRSDGADGKEGTADDVIVSSRDQNT
ncbi:MAG TPA: type II secretion system protein GspG [Pyrinomonadaceae bacterium]|jgi:hypothetical protein|nr:type II secretion system protein GspG [Pyrinomonadaceae bacterium]